MFQQELVRLIACKDWQSLPDLLKGTKDRLKCLNSMGETEEFAHEAIDIDGGVMSNLTELETMTRKEIEGRAPPLSTRMSPL